MSQDNLHVLNEKSPSREIFLVAAFDFEALGFLFEHPLTGGTVPVLVFCHDNPIG